MIRLSDCAAIRLSADTQIRAFDCGENDLNDFLLNAAKIHTQDLLSVTLLFEYGNTTVAFYSVCNDNISLDSFRDKTAFDIFRSLFPKPKRFKSFPAVKLARLGVHSTYQSAGIGTQILDYIKMSFTTRNKTGCRYVTVDAYNNERTLRFYQRNGFDFLTAKDDKRDTRLMYFDLKRFAHAS